MATSKAISKPGTSGSLNLGEEQKRWVVVGISLNKILLPSLRGVLKTEIHKHYNNLKTSQSIHKQKLGTHLVKDGSFTLNYGSINNNEVNYGKKVKSYDYTVKSEIDLAKLYLRPYMAKFSAFDDTCDLSAVLGILSSASVFPPPIQKTSKDVRQDVRNEWGHCNFSKWSDMKFLKSFQQMDLLVQSLSLPPVEERRLIKDLSDWEKNGMQLCMGHIVDADLVKLIEVEVAQLSSDFENLKGTQDEAKGIADALKCISESFEEFKQITTKALKALEDSNQDLQEKFVEVTEFTSTLSSDLKNLEYDHECLVEQVQESKEEITRRVDEIEFKQENLDERVKALENAIESKSTMSEGSVFQAPNRIPCFYGRERELDHLQKPLQLNSSCTMSAICGLGGTGKTSLAIEHIWKAEDIYKGGVFWLAAESLGLFKNSLSEIARLLGTFDEDFTKTLSKTLHWLQSRKDLWCLVIDNLDEYDLKGSAEIMKLLCGHWKRNATGHIIITTRREVEQIQEDIPDIPNENCIHLGNLTQHESIHFLKLRTKKGNDGDDETLKELAAELGCLPLALEQAAAYIKCTNVSFLNYLEQFKKQRLNTLRRYKARYPAQDTSKDRIAVHTTWELNFEYLNRHEVGQAATLIMDVSAFLCSDDIPFEIINEGLPRVTNEDLHSCLSSPVGLEDIVSALTKFSLFQKFTDTSISVHRLVQEVIRTNISTDRQKDVLQNACRMLCYAFENTNSPEDVCKSFQGDSVFIQSNLPSLSMWSTLGAHANALQGHLLAACEKDSSLRHHLLYTEETAELLNEASVYLSVCRQKVEALELQKTKLEVMTKLDTASEEKLAHLRYFEIPLRNVNFKLISHCMGHQRGTPKTNTSSETTNCKDEADKWREKGNEVFKNQDYGQAIDFYTLALKHFSSDCKSLCNRALCYLKMSEAEKALEDCRRCLRLDKHNQKALTRKAWSLLEISKEKPNMCGRVKATASLALYADPTTSRDERFKQLFPNIDYKEVSSSKQFMDELECSHFVPGMTFLLKNGCYDLPQGLTLTKDLQLVAVGDQVSFKFGGQGLIICAATVYFEGISFPKGGESLCCSHEGSITMYKCHVSSGRKGYENFQKGASGCANTDQIPCESTNTGEPSSEVSRIRKVPWKFVKRQVIEATIVEDLEGGMIRYPDGSMEQLRPRKTGRREAIDNDIYTNTLYDTFHVSSGQKGCENFPKCKGGSGCANTDEASEVLGIPGIRIIDSSCGYFEECEIEGCGGGGILCDGDGSQVLVKACKVYNNHQAGLEARNGGCLKAFDNDIYSNAFHAILIGPSTGACSIIHNEIYENKKEGIILRQSMNAETMIKENRIYHNLSFGISLDQCQVGIERNDIFENGFYGIYAKNSTTAIVDSNHINNNKCGGIYLGINFSGRFIISRNTLRDNSGVWLTCQETDEDRNIFLVSTTLGTGRPDPKKQLFLPEGETRQYSNPPILFDNEEKNNKDGMFHPKRKTELVQKECAFCRSTTRLRTCLGCNIASYCSRACQKKHRKKHRGLCLAVSDEYCVTVDFKMNSSRIRSDGYAITANLVEGSKTTQCPVLASRRKTDHLQVRKPNPKNNTKFIVKVQTEDLNCNPSQELVLYDESGTVNGTIQSPDVYHMIMECGVLIPACKNTKKKAFFYAAFPDSEGKKLKIYLSELAPFQEW